MKTKHVKIIFYFAYYTNLSFTNIQLNKPNNIEDICKTVSIYRQNIQESQGPAFLDFRRLKIPSRTIFIMCQQ